MGYRLNRLDEPVFIAVSKPLLTECGIRLRLGSCVRQKKSQILYMHSSASGVRIKKPGIAIAP